MSHQGADHGESENVENGAMLNGAYVSMNRRTFSKYSCAVNMTATTEQAQHIFDMTPGFKTNICVYYWILAVIGFYLTATFFFILVLVHQKSGAGKWLGEPGEPNHRVVSVSEEYIRKITLFACVVFDISKVQSRQITCTNTAS
jgi:hypothetical protein